MPRTWFPRILSVVLIVFVLIAVTKGYYLWPRFPEKRFLYPAGAHFQEAHPALFRPILYLNPQAKLLSQEDEPTGVPNLMRYG